MWSLWSIHLCFETLLEGLWLTTCCPEARVRPTGLSCLFKTQQFRCCLYFGRCRTHVTRCRGSSIYAQFFRPKWRGVQARNVSVRLCFPRNSGVETGQVRGISLHFVKCIDDVYTKVPTLCRGIGVPRKIEGKDAR